MEKREILEEYESLIKATYDRVVDQVSIYDILTQSEELRRVSCVEWEKFGEDERVKELSESLTFREIDNCLNNGVKYYKKRLSEKVTQFEEENGLSYYTD